jgi:hypothetical protein
MQGGDFKTWFSHHPAEKPGISDALEGRRVKGGNVYETRFPYQSKVFKVYFYGCLGFYFFHPNPLIGPGSEISVGET